MNSDINLKLLRGADGAVYVLPYLMDGIVGLTRFMKQVVYGSSLFHTEFTRRGGRVKAISALGNHLEHLHGYSQIYSSEYTFSPLLAFFFEQYRRHRIKDYALVLDRHDPDRFSSDLFNDFVLKMRREAASTRLKKRVADWESKSKKNLQRLERFERTLFQRFSRIMAIRLDFNYHKATFTPGEVERAITEAKVRKERDLAAYWAGADISAPSGIEGRISLEEVQRDRERLFANMKGKPSLFKHLVGYVWHIEHGREAGYHLHVFLFFDGAEVHKHEYIAQQIGQYWRDVITHGRSYFENCNRSKSKYRGGWALGLIDHWDASKREKLAHAMQYFCKTSQLVQVVPYRGCRLFGSGFTRRYDKGAGGRPRIRHS